LRVDLSTVVGRYAYVGFAGATGALTAKMEVQGWTLGPL